GSGGSVELDAYTGSVSMSGHVIGTAGGSVEEGGGFAGEFDAFAPLGSISLLDDLDLVGGDGGGGGDGGDVSLVAGGTVTIGANIDSDGGLDTTTQGFGNGGGGSPLLQGCGGAPAARPRAAGRRPGWGAVQLH